MTTPEVEPSPSVPAPTGVKEEQEDERKRRLLLLILLALLLLFCCVAILFIRYLAKPQPLPQLLPVPVNSYPPSYKFSIVGVDGPVGVAVSPDNQRVYITESKGQRLIKEFDRSGNLIGSFSPNGTSAGSRQPTYIAVDATGRVFVVDRFNNDIDLFDANGNYLDAIIAPDMTISKFIATQIQGAAPTGTKFIYDGINHLVLYQLPGQDMKQVKYVPSTANWSPLGIRFDAKGDLIYTDITTGFHSVHIIPAASMNGSWVSFNPTIQGFGTEGNGVGQMQFPNNALTDSKGNIYVSDGDNGRILEFKPDLSYVTFFGFGTGEDGLNLPRGMWMDSKDHLHVTDAVGSMIRVYDVSGTAPVFLYNFGLPGTDDGQFNFPIDICIDGTGRVYVADRDNDRVQIWSY
jgi:DNA-binding beta-propeller fold protein YncE